MGVVLFDAPRLREASYSPSQRQLLKDHTELLTNFMNNRLLPFMRHVILDHVRPSIDLIMSSELV